MINDTSNCMLHNSCLLAGHIENSLNMRSSKERAKDASRPSGSLPGDWNTGLTCRPELRVVGRTWIEARTGVSLGEGEPIYNRHRASSQSYPWSTSSK